MRKAMTMEGTSKRNTLTVPAEKRNGMKKVVNMRPSLVVEDLDLDAIREEDMFQDLISSARKYCSIRETLDHETLKKIDTYRALRLPTLRNMNEEECLQKYISDPFFRKKLEYELLFLKRSTNTSTKPEVQESKENLTTFTDIDNRFNSMTFRQYLHKEQVRKMDKKNKFQNLIRRVSSQEQFQAQIHP